MLSQDQIDHLRSLGTTIAMLNSDYNSLLQLLKPDITKANAAYQKLQSEINKQFPYTWVTCYECPVSNLVYDSFDIELVADADYFLAHLTEIDRDNEVFNWTIKVPFKDADLPRFIEQQRNEWVTFAQQKKEADEKVILEKQRRQYEELKQKFEPKSL
jgi:hypothetical protein